MKRLKTGTKICYAVGNLGYGVVSQAMTTFMMFFGTSVLGIRGSLVGLCVALSAFWDGLSDPIVGYLSDITPSKFWGRRLGYLFFGTLGIVVFNILLWSVPSGMSEIGKFFWLLLTLLALETANTCFATPYVALGIDIAPGYNEQSTLQGYKTVFFILGMVLPSVLMMIFMPGGEQGQLSQSGYIYIAYTTSILALICGLITVFGTFKKAKAVHTESSRKKEKNAFFKIFYNFFLVLKKRNYGAIILSYSVALISTAFLTSVGMHIFTYCFHFNSTQIPIIMSALFLGAILSQPFWIYLSRRIDKKPTLRWSYFVILVGIFLTFWVFVFRESIGTDICFYVVLLCIFVCGFGSGALYSLPMSMFADNVTMDKLKTGENKSATYSGYMTFAYNVANSLALFVIGILLDLIKFDASQPVQALKVQNYLGLIVFGGCAVSIAIAMMIISRYNLKRSDILKQQLLAKRKDKNKK